MSTNSLLHNRNGSDQTGLPGYHRSMDSNARYAQAPAPWHHAAPATAPARRWGPAAIIPAAIIAAAILVGLLGGAAILRHKTNAPATTVTTQAADSNTCHAWKTARDAIVAAPKLPQGWDWDTPGIDATIHSRAEMTNAALDIFAPTIAGAPAEVAGAASDYVAAKRVEMQQLVAHTYTGSNSASNAAYRLDALCGLSD